VRIVEADLASIADEHVRGGFVLLLNLVEQLNGENAKLRVENLCLRDEIQ
jgi:hypothetical protein